VTRTDGGTGHGDGHDTGNNDDGRDGDGGHGVVHGDDRDRLGDHMSDDNGHGIVMVVMVTNKCQSLECFLQSKT
jgi:hypothetical protein